MNCGNVTLRKAILESLLKKFWFSSMNIKSANQSNSYIIKVPSYNLLQHTIKENHLEYKIVECPGGAFQFESVKEQQVIVI